MAFDADEGETLSSGTGSTGCAASEVSEATLQWAIDEVDQEWLEEARAAGDRQSEARNGKRRRDAAADKGETLSNGSSESECSSEQESHQKKPKLVACGGVEYHQFATALPPGFPDIRAYGQWSRWLAQKLFSPAEGDEPDSHNVRLSRTKNNLEHGFVTHCDFAGYRGLEHGLAQMEVEMTRYGLQPGWLQQWRATEISRNCLSLMVNSKRPPEHTFPGLISLLSPRDAETIKSMRPPKGSSDAKMKKCYEHMQAWMKHNPQAFSHRRCGEKCLNHPGRNCAVTFNAKDPEAPWTDTPGQRPLVVNSSSPMCTPWTIFGKRKGLSHEAMESWHLYMADTCGARDDSSYDLNFMENGPETPVDFWVANLSRKKAPKYVVRGPDDLGFCASRCRLAGCTVNEEELFWTGPSGLNMTQDFLRFFHSRVVIEADIFATQDSESNTHKYYEQLSKIRKTTYTPGMDPRELLAEHGKQNINRALDMTMTGKKCGVLGTAICDSSQNVGKWKCRTRISPWMPTLMRSSEMVQIRKGFEECLHVFTPGELAFSQGWPTLKASPKKLRDTMMFDLGSLNPNQARIMYGNGIHLAMITALHFYILSHVVRKDIISRLRMPLKNDPDDLEVPDTDYDTDT